MNDVEKYLFDLRGYLILEDVLSPQEVAGLNSLIDRQGLDEPGVETKQARFGGFLNWDKTFCDLLDRVFLSTENSTTC